MDSAAHIARLAIIAHSTGGVWSFFSVGSRSLPPKMKGLTSGTATFQDMRSCDHKND
jgi:hypothetical protein